MISRLMHGKHALSILLILLAILVFASSVTVQNLVTSSFAAIQKFMATQGTAGILLFIVVGGLSSMFTMLSIVPFIPVGILTWGISITTALVLSGWVLGGIGSFLLARWVGRPVLKKFVSLEHIDHYLDLLPQKMEFEILLLFRFAVPAEIPGYVVGLTKFPFIQYFVATLLSELPFSIISVYGSQAFLQKNYLPLLMWILIGMAIVSGTFHLFRKILKQYKEQKAQEIMAEQITTRPLT